MTHLEVNYVIIITVMIVIGCANLNSSLNVCKSISYTLVKHRHDILHYSETLSSHFAFVLKHCHRILHCFEIFSPHFVIKYCIIVLKHCHHILHYSETLSPHIALF